MAFFSTLSPLSCPSNALKFQIPPPKWKLAPKYLHMQARLGHVYPLEPFLPFHHYNVNLVNKQLHPQLDKGRRPVSLFRSTCTVVGWLQQVGCLQERTVKKKVWLWVRRGFSRALENVMLSQLFEIPEKHKKEIWAWVFTSTDSEAPITLPLDPHNTFYHLIVLYFFLPHYTGGGCL